MCTKIINDQLTDLFYNFIEMEDRIAANERYADLNSSDMRFLSAVGKGVLGDDCLIDCSQIPMIYCNYDTQTIFYKGIMPSEKVLDFPVDCNTLTGSVNL